ncbi:MAG: thiol:disulfide interchange protein [Alphaproteobacteria bacterium]|nr:thiol:disulfide interchange protein [Alphaproteobacteria bacterium]
MLRLLTLALAALLSVLAAPAMAGGSVVRTDHVEASLVSEARAIEAGGTLTVGFLQKIRPGWHTYWKNPGDSGEPIAVEWDLPEGFTVGPMQWPHPERLPVGPLMNFGYSGEVLLLSELTAPDNLAPGALVTLRARATWLVCEDVCIPEEGEFALTLPATDGPPLKDSALAPAFEKARAALPAATPWLTTFLVDNEVLNLFIAAPELARIRIAEASFFPDRPDIIVNAAVQRADARAQGLLIRTSAGRLLTDNRLGTEPLSEFTGDLVVRSSADGPGSAYRVSATQGPIPTLEISEEALGVTDSGMTWPLALAFAFLGGLILNLMPCVFPVLSMKAMAYLGKAGGEIGQARIEALAYTLGVVGSFLLIGGLLVSLKEAGAEIGWGFQLQSPLIVGALALLFLVIGLNLSGVFEFGGRFQNAGQELTTKSGVVGAFFTGVLAVVVASPCTAPFMGAAIGFAVLEDPSLGQAVFAALGLGMAAPFLLLVAIPPLFRLLPRPGAWMVRLKELLAFPMYASAGWLVWVLVDQLGADGILTVLTAAVFLAFAAWAFGVSQREGGPLGVIGAGLGAIIALSLLWILPSNPVPSARSTIAAQAGNGPIAERFTPERLASLRNDGKPVFVNLTAAWCITCQINEQLALSSTAIARAFTERGVAYLKGDWTNRDPVITRILEAYDRAGVPLYLFYAPGHEEAQILPQILTEGIVLEALATTTLAGANAPAPSP